MDARLTQRRLLLCVAAIVALVSVASACGGGGGDASAAPKAPPLATFTGSGLTFTHPAAWKVYPFPSTEELHFRPLAYLSTQPLHDPCSKQGETTSCGFPVARLEPGGVLVYWLSYGIPAMGLGAGKRIQVDGHPATRVVKAGGECSKIGADRTIDVTVETSPPPSAFAYFTACLRGPGLAQAEKSVDALLASTKFTSQ